MVIAVFALSAIPPYKFVVTLKHAEVNAKGKFVVLITPFSPFEINPHWIIKPFKNLIYPFWLRELSENICKFCNFYIYGKKVIDWESYPPAQ